MLVEERERGGGELDPNPDPPPLVEEIRMFKANLCLRLYLYKIMCSRRLEGVPDYHVVIKPAPQPNAFKVQAYLYVESQGLRPYMEDRNVCEVLCDGRLAFYSVLDGHGLEGEGHIVSDYASRNVTKALEKYLLSRRKAPDASLLVAGQSDAQLELSPQQMQLVQEAAQAASAAQAALAMPERVTASRLPAHARQSQRDLGYGAALREEHERATAATDEENFASASFVRDAFDLALTELDGRMRRIFPMAAESNGTTLVGVLVQERYLDFCNLGDSRAVLINADYSLDFVTLDHKPTVPLEVTRIHQAGGYIDDARVNGDLAVSRTLGDVTYKPFNAPRRLCPISNQPDVTRVVRLPRHRCVLLASDGLWDAMSSAEVAAVLKSAHAFDVANAAGAAAASYKDPAYKRKADAFFLKLLVKTLNQRLSGDNITIALVMLDGVPEAKAGVEATDPAAAVAASSSSSSSSSSAAAAAVAATATAAAAAADATATASTATAAKKGSRSPTANSGPASPTPKPGAKGAVQGGQGGQGVPLPSAAAAPTAPVLSGAGSAAAAAAAAQAVVKQA
jgi:serine/threonine protein phosphatase PrpC